MDTTPTTPRRPPIRKIIPIVLLLVALGVTALVLSRRHAEPANLVRASGIVEARTIEIASEVAGVIVERPIEKGMPIKAGQLIAVVASEVTAANLDQARAALAAATAQWERAQEAVTLQQGTAEADVQRAATGMATAQARQADVLAGSRPQEIRAAQAALAQATAAQGQAETQLRQLRAGLRPEEIEQAAAAAEAADAALAAARARLADLEAGARPQEVQEAQAAVRKAETAADKTQKDYARAKTLVVQGAIAPQQLDAAQAAAEAAQADLKAARERLDLVKAGSRTDQITAARAQVQQALAQQRSAEKALTLARKGPRTEEIQRAEQAVAQAQAARAAAQAQLRLAQEGARPHQKTIAGRQVREARAALSLAEANRRQVAVRQAEAQAAREQVLQAEAAVRAAEAGLDKFRITARVTGMIDDTHLRVGEVVRTGSAIATEVDFSDTWVTVYVPEPRLSQIVLGQSARVTVDGQPDRTFTGRVRRISQQAEFTPKFVQTQEERTRTVFAVEIAVANDEGLLKPGMPADAVIETQGGVSAAPTGTPPGRRP